MAVGAYSFIDIAVLDGVRARFAAGDALAILSSDLDQVVWANGPGAELFGYPDIEAIMGASARLGLAARRQIAATPGFPAIGHEKSLLIRISTGVTSRAVAFLASTIALPDGEKAILLAAPAATHAAHGRETAERAIAGFAGAGYFAALVDDAGRITACSDGFSRLGISEAVLLALVRDVRGDDDRLLKRLVPAGKALFPAGFARLTDDPAQHLLLVVEEDQSAPDEAGRNMGGAGHEDVQGSADRMLETPPGRILEQDNQPDLGPTASGNAQADEAEPAESSNGKPKGEVDRWYFTEREETSASSEPAGEPARPTQAGGPAKDAAAPSRPKGPVRFVWRTDAESRFSAISHDFAAAVGLDAADVIGRRFDEVADAFALDPDGQITGLLERRDTWSGRSVMWPVAGTDLKVPVDLAALPVYSRDRSFEGFRGFGVARMNDAVIDPDALGLALVGREPGADGNEAVPLTASPASDQTEQGATEKQAGAGPDPFRGEIPALVIDNTPERRFSDKVIRLAEHRPPTVERSLTPVEQIAFREIGARLKKESSTAPVRQPPRQTEAAGGDEVVGTDGPAGETPPRDTAGIARVEGEEAEAAAGKASQPRAIAAERDEEKTESDPVPSHQPASGGEDDAGQAARTEGAEPDTVAPEQLEAAKEEQAEGDNEAVVAAADIAAPPAQLAPRAQTAANDHLPAAFSGRLRDGAAEAIDVSVLSRLPIPILIHSGDALHHANRAFFDLTGYRSLAEFQDEGGLGALFAEPYEADDVSVPGDHRLRLKKRTGEELPVDALLQSVPWNGGKALLLAIAPIAGVWPDTGPARQPAVDELQARVDELRTILDTATDGVVLIANDGTIRSISRPAEALFGFDGARVVGEAFTALFAVESQRAARDYLNGLSDNGVASVLNDGREVIGREAQGRFIPLFMTIGKLPGDSGYCAVLRDITQWKRAEEELTQARAHAERASSQKTNFLARVSHEIRTPLNAIIGFSELMLDEKFGSIGNDRYRDYLRDINRSGNHVLDLVNDLLDISKIEAGELEMSYEAVSLNEALAETVALMQPQANRERVIIRSSFASRLPEIVADLRSIRQIALNLLSNAIRYTQAGGQVIVSTSYETSGDIVMRVRDTGIGMSHADIEQALKPFKQINALKRGRGDGTGLGLPLTKAMVEANRARFAINSTPGEGTMVEVTFPSTRVLAD
jgi:PAS domain S-box-containing protein